MKLTFFCLLLVVVVTSAFDEEDYDYLFEYGIGGGKGRNGTEFREFEENEKIDDSIRREDSETTTITEAIVGEDRSSTQAANRTSPENSPSAEERYGRSLRCGDEIKIINQLIKTNSLLSKILSNVVTQTATPPHRTPKTPRTTTTTTSTTTSTSSSTERTTHSTTTEKKLFQISDDDFDWEGEMEKTTTRTKKNVGDVSEQVPSFWTDANGKSTIMKHAIILSIIVVVVLITACSIICFLHFCSSRVCCCCKEQQQEQQQQQENEYEDVGETNMSRPTISAPLVISAPLAISDEQSTAQSLTPPPPALPSRIPEPSPSRMTEKPQQEDGARGMPSMGSFVLRRKIDLHLNIPSVQPKVSVEQIKDGRRRLGVVAAQAAKWEFPPKNPQTNEK